MKHKFFTVALVIILSVVVSSGTVNANSIEASVFSNDEIINQIEESLTEGYQEYYNIDHSHIVMITAHDGVSYRYSGHTNDRQNAVTSLSGSKAFYHVIY